MENHGICRELHRSSDTGQIHCIYHNRVIINYLVKKLTDRVSWVENERKRHNTYSAKENAYWTMCLSKSASQLSRLGHMMSSILGSSDARRNETSPSAQTLLEFFNEKVAAVRHSTGGSPAKSYLDPLAASFSEFDQCTHNAVEKVIQPAASKFCSLDPIPTTLLKEFLPKLLRFVTRMCNA